MSDNVKKRLAAISGESAPGPEVKPDPIKERIAYMKAIAGSGERTIGCSDRGDIIRDLVILVDELYKKIKDAENRHVEEDRERAEEEKMREMLEPMMRANI